MQSAIGQSVHSSISALPEVLRGPVQRWCDDVLSAHDDPDLPGTIIAQLLKLVACSEYGASVLQREWDWFINEYGTLGNAPDRQALDEFVDRIALVDDIEAAQSDIRRLRHRWMLQILWREVDGDVALEETLGDLSHLADRLLDAAARLAARSVEERFGHVRDESGNPVALVILGMGKLGGRELNFSSDIDLIFLYPGGGDSDGQKCVSAQDYFTRISQRIVALLDEVTADGFAFRIDTRLRPFGDSGPPVTSFAAFESYLVQHGRDWERYAYVKARIVGPEPPVEVAAELQGTLITPFVYRRYLDFGVFESLRDMHAMIMTEVARREMADNIKLGPGGIREIEFIVQSLQLVRGGSRAELQQRQLLRVLPGLVGRHGLGEGHEAELANAYRFLRRLENFIQAIRDRQTHDLPKEAMDRARLCLAMGHADWAGLCAELDAYRDTVTAHFNAVAFREGVEAERPQHRVTELWGSAASPDEWQALLEQDGFRDASEVASKIAAFAAAPATRQVDKVAGRRLQTFIPLLLRRIRECRYPVIALNRVLALVEKVLRRSAYLALLNENPGVLARLVTLCEQSSYIADQIARYPVLLDELLDPSVHSSPLMLEELETDLQSRLPECADDDSELQMSELGQFQRANQFRIAIADLAGTLPIMKVSDSLTWLAEAVLRTTLDIAWRDLVARHGPPQFVIGGERHAAGFGIIAYGKLGGLEMSYGSDLDLVFLHDAGGSGRMTAGPKSIDNTVFFTRLVRRLSHFLTAQTGSGMLYEVDTRLRPDGQSGVMVSSLEAFERYQEDNAWTWEHQALLRARPVAGSEHIAKEFDRIRADTLATRVRRDTLREDVIDMRKRMRAKLDKSSTELFDLKQGSGGIGDIEFIVQYLVLQNAASDAALYEYSDNIRQLEALAKGNIIGAETAQRLQEVYREYRLRLHHLVLNDQPALTPAAEFAAQRQWVDELWQRSVGGL